jgi:hypothetical protein
MKALLTLLAVCLPTLSIAHPGHGAHLNEYPIESVSVFSIEAVLASIIVAAAIVLVVKKYKSKV